MKIRIEFDVSPSGFVTACAVVNNSIRQKLGNWRTSPDDKRYRTFVEIPDMPEVAEVKAEEVKEMKP